MSVAIRIIWNNVQHTLTHGNNVDKWPGEVDTVKNKDKYNNNAKKQLKFNGFNVFYTLLFVLHNSLFYRTSSTSSCSRISIDIVKKRQYFRIPTARGQGSRVLLCFWCKRCYRAYQSGHFPWGILYDCYLLTYFSTLALALLSTYIDQYIRRLLDVQMYTDSFV